MFFCVCINALDLFREENMILLCFELLIHLECIDDRCFYFSLSQKWLNCIIFSSYKLVNSISYVKFLLFSTVKIINCKRFQLI